MSLHSLPYDPATKRTKTRYVGSFWVGLHPDSLDELQVVRAGEHGRGIRLSINAPVDLARQDIIRIQEWLQKNGTYRELATERRDALVAAGTLALAKAEEAIGQAARALQTAAAAAREQGSTLTSRRSQSTDTAAAKSALDALQCQANSVRLGAFESFTKACQDAGLMERRSRS